MARLLGLRLLLDRWTLPLSVMWCAFALSLLLGPAPAKAQNLNGPWTGYAMGYINADSGREAVAGMFANHSSQYCPWDPAASWSYGTEIYDDSRAVPFHDSSGSVFDLQYSVLYDIGDFGCTEGTYWVDLYFGRWLPPGDTCVCDQDPKDNCYAGAVNSCTDAVRWDGPYQDYHEVWFAPAAPTSACIGWRPTGPNLPSHVASNPADDGPRGAACGSNTLPTYYACSLTDKTLSPDGIPACFKHLYSLCASVGDSTVDYSSCPAPPNGDFNYFDSDGDACPDWIEMFDVNADRKVDVGDTLSVAKRVAGQIPANPAQDAVLDVNHDGSFNVGDNLLEGRNTWDYRQTHMGYNGPIRCSPGS